MSDSSPPSSKSPLSFKSTPNPPPGLNQTATWSTEGGDGSRITWSVLPPPGFTGDPTQLAVTVTPKDSKGDKATVTAMYQGMAVITATQGKTTISRDVGVGEMFGYSAKGNLKGAPSNEWRVPDERPDDFPTFEQMTGYGMAYTRNRVVLNFRALGDARAGDPDTCYFTATTTTRGTTTGLHPDVHTYAYAPDGTLWRLPNGWGSISGDVPPDFPTLQSMEDRNAALSWAPPDPLPSEAAPAAAAGSGTSAYLTCYVLAVELFPAHSTANDVTTYYTMTKQP